MTIRTGSAVVTEYAGSLVCSRFGNVQEIPEVAELAEDDFVCREVLLVLLNPSIDDACPSVPALSSRSFKARYLLRNRKDPKYLCPISRK